MSDRKPKKLIAGLGNPGPEYEHTYHNAGFLAVDAMAEGCEWSAEPQKTFVYAKKEGLIFIKPRTFMNLSGEAVRRALAYFGLSPEDLLVIHDEADLPLGSYRFSDGGSSAGHHGIESIEASLGTKEFSRCRIGVRSDKKQDAKAGSFVLSPIPKAELESLYGVLAEVKAIVIEKVTPS